jgi:hypothetical protein
MQVLKNKKKQWETLGDGAANFLLDQGATGVASPNIYIYIYQVILLPHAMASSPNTMA